MLIVDLYNGVDMDVDDEQLREHGIPKGYVLLSSLTLEELWESYKWACSEDRR